MMPKALNRKHVSSDPKSMLKPLDKSTVEGMKQTMERQNGKANKTTKESGVVEKEQGVVASVQANGQGTPRGKALRSAGKPQASEGGGPSAYGVSRNSGPARRGNPPVSGSGNGKVVKAGKGQKGKSTTTPTYIRERLAPNQRAKVKLTVTVYQDKGSQGPMTPEVAMRLLGWTVVAVANAADKGERPEYKEAGKYHLLDLLKNKVLLANNSTNRPFRPGLARRYMLEILRGKWQLNGESLVFDWDNKAQSAQHRLAGLVLASQAFKKEPDKWLKYGWTKKGGISIEAIVVSGISNHPEVVDTLDLGQKRTLGDIIYRDSIFGGAEMSDAVRKKLSNVLAGATRLVWLRSSGNKVGDAPHFPPSEALDFIEQHPRLVEAVDEIWKLEGGLGQDGGKISRFTSLAYASGLYYMMMVSGTDPDEYLDKGVAALDYSMGEKAQEFWASLASGANLKETDPVFVVRELLPKIDAGSGMGRDEIVSMVIKAFNYWADGSSTSAKQLRIPKKLDPKTGKEKLAEDPRLGGIDIEGRERVEDDPGEKQGEGDTTREGSKAGKGWSEGDEAWVKQKGVEPYFVTIDSIYKADDGMMAVVTDADDGKPYECAVNELHLSYPK